MENLQEAFIQFPYLNANKSENHIRIRQNKVVPEKDEINSRREHYENEWQQEYYIIYNSYVLEEKESE